MGTTTALLSPEGDGPLVSACVIALSSSRAQIATAPWRKASTATSVVTSRDRQRGHSAAMAWRLVGLVLDEHGNGCNLDQAADQAEEEDDGEREQLVHGRRKGRHKNVHRVEKKAPVHEHRCYER